jgi:hypothetical protein
LDFQLDPKSYTEVLMAMEVGQQLRWDIVPSSMFFLHVRALMGS